MGPGFQGKGGAKNFQDLPVIVTVERTVQETYEGVCVEVSDPGILIEYESRNQRVSHFIPWTHVKSCIHKVHVLAKEPTRDADE